MKETEESLPKNGFGMHLTREIRGWGKGEEGRDGKRGIEKGKLSGEDNYLGTRKYSCRTERVRG